MSASIARPAAASRSSGYPVAGLARLPFPLRNVLRRWRGMLGMVIGVGIALGVVMTMEAVSKGEIAVFTADYLKSGAELFVITRGGTMIGVLPGDTPGTIKDASSRLSQIRGMAGVNAAVGVMSWSLEREREGPRQHDAPTELVATMGVDGDPEQIPGMLVLKEGRWLRRGDEVVIGGKVSREKRLGVGDSLRLGERTFTVVGIGRLRGFGFSSDSLVYLDDRALRQRADVGNLLNIIAVDTTRPDETRQRIDELGSLVASTPADLVHEYETVYASSLVVHWIFNGLSLTVAALFVASMLARSVAERRFEFATLRAIGVPSRAIMLTVSLEAILVCLIAGLLGTGISLALGAWINGVLAPAYGVEFFYTADVVLFGEVLILALGLGLVAGLFPARQAIRVDPVEVLREA